ncbi:MAG: methyltransferase domain-containing protein [Chloroflexota bacterium]
MPGLKQIVLDELQHRLGKATRYIPSNEPDQISFYYSGSIKTLCQLRTVVAIYQIQYFQIPRPKALLGHQNLHRVCQNIQKIRTGYPKQSFQSFTIKAAGRHSTVFQRLQSEISQQTNLTYQAEEADLVLRIRPATTSSTGWEVLIRVSPRPLSARSWRVADMPGALNGTTAAAMIALSKPTPADRFLNIMAGSGTLLIERLKIGPATQVVGGDISPSALKIAIRNYDAAALRRSVHLFHLKAEQTPFANGYFDVICADLPWGQLVGSRSHNRLLYPQILKECARIASPKARLVLLTHQIQLFDQITTQYKALWTLKSTLQVYQGGLHPQIYVFNRTSIHE